MKSKRISIGLLFMIGALAVLMTACTGEVSASSGNSDEGADVEMSAETSQKGSMENEETLEVYYPDEPELLGGWTASESAEVTDEVRELVRNATDGLLGVEYEPVAYLGSQLVAGSNHCVLCKASVVVPNSKPYYVFMYIYRDLDGNCSILKLEEIKLGI